MGRTLDLGRAHRWHRHRNRAAGGRRRLATVPLQVLRRRHNPASVRHRLPLRLASCNQSGGRPAVGWLCTVAPRFTRKPPQPASDIPRVEQGIRTTPAMIRTLLIAGALGIGALVLFTPEGARPAAVPVLGILVAMPLGTAAGLAHTRRLMTNSPLLYARWLERR